MKSLRANPLPWIVGTILAILGVCLARLIAPAFDGTPRIVTTVTGQLTALAGLFIICLGVRQRVKRPAREETPGS